MRDAVQVWDWISMTDIRTGYYMITHGVARLKDVATSELVPTSSRSPCSLSGTTASSARCRSATSRTSVRAAGRRSAGDDGMVPLPSTSCRRRMLHNEYMDALRAEDVDRIVATFRPNTANAIRSYLTDDYTVFNAEGVEELGDYYRALFDRYAIKDIRMINRVVESWFVFADLHWTVEAKTGDAAGQTFEFCTADLAPIDADGQVLGAHGIGTDPVPSAAAGPASMRPTATSGARRTCGAGSTTWSAERAAPLRTWHRHRLRPPIPTLTLLLDSSKSTGPRQGLAGHQPDPCTLGASLPAAIRRVPPGGARGPSLRPPRRPSGNARSGPSAVTMAELVTHGKTPHRGWLD